mmetsp:Transcript_2323/g.3432  ORF Transcript_2323/g.3432 Transcript_2323/m.3432 type:complete len:125 (-) Transcript_2323:276-650(-)
MFWNRKRSEPPRGGFQVVVTLVSGKTVALNVEEGEHFGDITKRLRRSFGKDEVNGALAAAVGGLWFEVDEGSTVGDVALEKNSPLRYQPNVDLHGSGFDLKTLDSEENLSSMRLLNSSMEIHPL